MSPGQSVPRHWSDTLLDVLWGCCWLRFGVGEPGAISWRCWLEQKRLSRREVLLPRRVSWDIWPFRPLQLNWNFSFFLGSIPLDLDWNWTTSSSRSSACWLQRLGHPCLHNGVSQCFIIHHFIRVCVYVYVSTQWVFCVCGFCMCGLNQSWIENIRKKLDLYWTHTDFFLVIFFPLFLAVLGVLFLSRFFFAWGVVLGIQHRAELHPQPLKFFFNLGIGSC